MHEQRFTIHKGRLCTRTDLRPVPENEPIFILRANDIHAITILSVYQDLVDFPGMKEQIAQTIRDFQAFQLPFVPEQKGEKG